MQKQNERPGVNMGCLSLLGKTIPVRKTKMYMEGIVDEARAHHKYSFLKKSTWAFSYLWTVGCQSLSDSWFNSCPFSKYDLQIRCRMWAHAPGCLSVFQKEKGASLSDMALLHSCNDLCVAWVVCLAEASEQDQQGGHSPTASVFTGFVIFNVILIANESFLHFLFCIFASLLPFFSAPLSPLLYSLPSNLLPTMFSLFFKSFYCFFMKYSWWARHTISLNLTSF